jgi:hypothetical protein
VRSSVELGDDVAERGALGEALLLHGRAQVQQPDGGLIGRDAEDLAAAGVLE